MPLPIHRFDNKQKEPYHQMRSKAYAAFKPSADKITDKGDPVEGADTSDSSPRASREASPARNQGFSVCGYLWCWYLTCSKTFRERLCVSFHIEGVLFFKVHKNTASAHTLQFKTV